MARRILTYTMHSIKSLFTLRPTSLLPALGLGLIALAWGLGGLQMVFMRERDEAAEALRARNMALDYYARQTLAARLKAIMDASAPRIRHAASDPLAPDAGLFLMEGETVRLPRPVIYAPGSGMDAVETYRALRSGAGITGMEAGSPWARRMTLFHQFTAALRSGNTARIEDSLRAILEHRALYKIGAARDIPYMAALMAAFLEKSDPDPGLARGLLRDYLPPGPGKERMEGLQRALLRAREKFTKPEFDALVAIITALSARAGLETANFLAMAAVVETPVPPVSGAGPLPALFGGRWYADQVDGAIYGVLVDLPALLTQATGEMRRLGLIGPSDLLEAPARSAGYAPAANLGAKVKLGAMEDELKNIVFMYRLKAGLVIFLGALIVSAAALGLHTHRRKERELAMKADFVAAVSHELKTPLASARLVAETLERKLAGAPEARDYPARLVKDIDSLWFMVENILSFNRLDKGGWTLHKTQAPLEDALDRNLEETAQRSPVPVEMRVEGAAGVILDADPELLSLLFMNLANNAVKHGSRNPVKMRVTVSQGAGARILFGDNGPGIPREEWEMVFTEFYRRGAGPDGALRGGNGLGLAICRRIMKEHGGSIRIATSGPEGTVFEIYFPA